MVAPTVTKLFKFPQNNFRSNRAGQDLHNNYLLSWTIWDTGDFFGVLNSFLPAPQMVLMMYCSKMIPCVWSWWPPKWEYWDSGDEWSQCGGVITSHLIIIENDFSNWYQAMWVSLLTRYKNKIWRILSISRIMKCKNTTIKKARSVVKDQVL